MASSRASFFAAACVSAFLLGCNLQAAAQRVAGPARGSAGAGTQREGRLATPPNLDCPRDNVTSFTGRVLAYRRAASGIFIRVRTDEETTEEFTLRQGRRGDPAKFFRLRGEPFGPGDWREVEARRGRLKPNMRATVWACYRNNEPAPLLIDWKPPAP